jgi:flagellar biosynthesis chaperone FliJ
MTSRRTDGLAVLARLKRHETENVALEMAEVNRALGQLEAERQALMEQLNDRGDPDAVEATRVLSDFIRNVSATIHHKETQANRLRENSADMHRQLNDLFAEAKRIDLIRHRRAEARKRAADDAATAAQDEGFLSIWLQNGATA